MYDRETEGSLLELGVRALENDLLRLYDRQTQSEWRQLDGRCVKGPLSGRQLGTVPSTLTTWSRWRSLYPDTDVYVKPNAIYRARFTASEIRETVEKGDEFPRQGTLVLGLEIDGSARAYPLHSLATLKLVNDWLGGEPVGIWFSPDSVAFQVFRRRHGELTLRLELTGQSGVVRDGGTGSRWDLSSLRAIDGAYQGERLSHVNAVLTRWGTWRLVHVDSDYWRPTGSSSSP